MARSLGIDLVICLSDLLYPVSVVSYKNPASPPPWDVKPLPSFLLSTMSDTKHELADVEKVFDPGRFQPPYLCYRAHLYL